MTQQKRRRRDVRQKPSQPLYLQERDIEVVQACYKHRALTTQQIQGLFFGEKNKTLARDRLEKLYDHGYLDRAFMPVKMGAGRSPTFYIVDRAGYELLRRERDPELKWYSSSKEVSDDFLEHTFAINQVMVAVMLGAAAAGFWVEEWWSEREVKADYDRVEVKSGKDRRQSIPIVPDAYFVIVAGNRRFHFFLELDRATMALKRFKQKVEGYIAYYQSGRYTERFGTKSLRILTVVESKTAIGAKRIENIKQVAEAAGGQKRFWFAQLKDISPAQALTAPIWYKGSEGGRFSLFDMAEFDQD